LHFPVLNHGNPLVLWTSRAFLEKASPYFALLFGSTFSESRGIVPPSGARPEDGYDSDDEADSVYAKRTVQTKADKSRMGNAKIYHVLMS
jgi:hypothetical protein